MSGDSDEQVPVIVSAFEILPNGVEVPIGEPRQRTISRGALDLLHENSDALDDRRERARDAAYDAPGAAESQMPNIDAAIETAVRVRITREIIEAAMGEPFITTHEALARAFRAAGFEVEQ